MTILLQPDSLLSEARQKEDKGTWQFPALDVAARAQGPEAETEHAAVITQDSTKIKPFQSVALANVCVLSLSNSFARSISSPNPTPERFDFYGLLDDTQILQLSLSEEEDMEFLGHVIFVHKEDTENTSH